MTTLNELSALNEDEATLNITWGGENGNLSDPIPFGASTTDIKSWASEAVSNGNVAGIAEDTNVDFGDFIVDRYRASTEKPYNSVFLRPKTPFGV
jgi:hypothetical protein